ncbi:MAG: CO dehydrogenase/CO-methylating acetyl-CoA synthase complex subunit beta [Chloroflexi bacterium]|nr:CO dehydrogenase/CO-methylating acetyl-CoA synthase complex subunit beta [Chloroflexota bacterium]
MSRYIATRAIRGANAIVAEAEKTLDKAIKEMGPQTPVAFTNTAYFLPTIYGYTGVKVETLGDMVPIMKKARSMLTTTPPDKLWLPYLGETLDAGVATLFAEEIIEGVRFVRKEQPERMPLDGIRVATAEVSGAFTSPDENVAATQTAGGRGNGHYVLNGPIDDIQLRTWGIQLVDGRMPGFAAIVGCAKSNEVAVRIVRELQRRGILIFLCGNVNGRSIIHQLLEEGVQLGYDTYTVPFGTDTISAIYPLGFATRSALTFGGMTGGQARDILLYNKNRVFAFVLALGEVDDLKYATAAGAITYGFPVIADTLIPQILPTGITTYEHVVSMPFDEIEGKDDLERADRLVQRCIEVRGVKIQTTAVDIPVAYGPAFEGEIVRRDAMQSEFGGPRGTCFEILQMMDSDDVQDGRVEVVGPDLDAFEVGTNIPLGIMVKVAGRRMQEDFEPVLERQIHHMINGAEGVQHIGQRDITWIRISINTFGRGFRLRHLGNIIHARLHAGFSAIVDKVQVTLYTERQKVEEFREAAREVYQARNLKTSNLTDESVDTFYSCTLCQSFAPSHVCIINPERVGLCGAYNWLDCKASYELNPTGPNQPILKRGLIDAEKGEWESANDFLYQHSNSTFRRLTLYSIMDAPMTACGCFECIMMLIPEVNGFMVVSRDDPSMTPAGMKFSTLAGVAGGGQQSPGMMGHGKYYLLSKKFIPKEGGLKRVVWMSANLKESMGPELREACKRIGVPDLLDKIPDGNSVTTVEQLMAYLQEVGHPVLTMESLI